MCLGVPHRASYFYLYLSPVYLPSYCLHYPTPFTLLFYYQPNSYHSPLRYTHQYYIIFSGPAADFRAGP